MEFKNFEIDGGSWLNEHKNVIIQHQKELKKLDQVLEQFQDFHFKWYLYFYDGQFGLVCSYLNKPTQNQKYYLWKPEIDLISANLDHLANHKILQFGLETMKRIISNPQIHQEQRFNIEINFDKKKITLIHDGRDGNFEQNQFEFPLTNLDENGDLIVKAIDFSTILYRNRYNDFNLKDSLELQLLKTIMTKENNETDDLIINQLKSDLTNPNLKNLTLEHPGRINKNEDCLDLGQIDWKFVIDLNEQIKFELAIKYHGWFYQFKPLKLSFSTIAKLANNQEIDLILKSWKNALRKQEKQFNNKG